MNRHFWRRGTTWALAVVTIMSSGCSFFPESMQPMNLQKLNRYPGPATDPFYSVKDPHATYSPYYDTAEEDVEEDVHAAENQAS